MKNLKLLVSTVAMSAVWFNLALAQPMSGADGIKLATSPLPAALRDSATVISYDGSGMPHVVRQGTGHIFCVNNSTPQAFSIGCRGDATRAAADFQAVEKAQGKDAKIIAADTNAAYASGKLSRPPVGTMTYSRAGKTEAESRIMWRMLMPNVKGEDLGLPVSRVNSSSLWMMNSGQPGAHIMIPQTASMDDMPPPPPKGM
jgi:hypothetical protein